MVWLVKTHRLVEVWSRKQSVMCVSWLERPFGVDWTTSMFSFGATKELEVVILISKVGVAVLSIGCAMKSVMRHSMFKDNVVTICCI